MFLGHLDTVHVRGWQEHWAGTEREDPFAAPVIDGEIWGRGAADLKGGICALLAALDTVRRAGPRLRGDIVCVFPGDEESGEPNTGAADGNAQQRAHHDGIGRFRTDDRARPNYPCRRRANATRTAALNTFIFWEEPMFLDVLRRRKPMLIEAAIRLHQENTLPANTYVIDVEAVEQNAEILASKF
jgi:hypothetical protein